MAHEGNDFPDTVVNAVNRESLFSVIGVLINLKSILKIVVFWSGAEQYSPKLFVYNESKWGEVQVRKAICISSGFCGI